MIIDQELEDKVHDLCMRLDILEAFTYVKHKNPSNNLPYHNWYHILCMVEKCVEGANYHNLPYRSVRHLAISALFHDFAHTGGKKDDSININLAICGCRDFLAPKKDWTGIDSNEIQQIIRITQYPYIEDPICIEQRIIRDADLMQCFRSTWREMILGGLREEMSIRLNKDITEKEMVAGQVNFLKNINPRSDWGKNIMYDRGGIDNAVFNFTFLT